MRWVKKVKHVLDGGNTLDYIYHFMKNISGKVKSFIPFTAVTFAASGVGDTFIKMLSKGLIPAACLVGCFWGYHETKDL